MEQRRRERIRGKDYSKQLKQLSAVCVCVRVCVCDVYTPFSSSAGNLWSRAGGVCALREGVGKYSAPHQ